VFVTNDFYRDESPSLSIAETSDWEKFLPFISHLILNKIGLKRQELSGFACCSSAQRLNLASFLDKSAKNRITR
jgi:hypothetical protein